MIVFSATIPTWLKQRVSMYMSKENFSFINLIGDSQKKTSENVQHFALRCNDARGRAALLLKLFEKYAADLEQSQSIIFCQTKQECDQLLYSNHIQSSYSAGVLHGNLSQRKREEVLQVKSLFTRLFTVHRSSFEEFSTWFNSFLDHNGYFGAWIRYSSSGFDSFDVTTTGRTSFFDSSSFILRIRFV